MKKKDFLEKWQWASLEEADKTLTEIEQKIWEFVKKNQDLEAKLAEKEKEIETIQENSDKNIDYLIEFASLIEDQKDCNRMLKALERVSIGKKYIVDKEHQEAMRVADKTIKVLDKALELACANHPAVCIEAMDCSKGVDCVGCLMEYYKAQARKELKGVKNEIRNKV